MFIIINVFCFNNGFWNVTAEILVFSVFMKICLWFSIMLVSFIFLKVFYCPHNLYERDFFEERNNDIF